MAGDEPGIIATGVALGVTLWPGAVGSGRHGRSGRGGDRLLVLGLAQEYHFAMLVIPSAVALARWFEGASRPTRDGLWLALAFALLAVPLPYEDPVLAAGWTALLAYPRLYGAWLLWGWIVRQMWADRRAETVSHIGVVGG